MCELLTCRPAYTGMAPAQIMFQVLGGGRPALPAWMPLDLAALIRACWAAAPHARPSMDGVLARLRANELLKPYAREDQRPAAQTSAASY